MYQLDLALLDDCSFSLPINERVCEYGECPNVGTTDEMVQVGDDWFCPEHALLEPA